MFEDFTDDGCDCDASVIIEVTLISLTILHNRNNCTKWKLARDKLVHQHSVEETLEPFVERKRTMEEMLSMNIGIITSFPLLHAENRVDCFFESNLVGGARTIAVIVGDRAILLLKLLL